MPAFRRRGIGTQLLDAIEQNLGRASSTRLRINGLAVNASAQASYERAGFAPFEILYEKSVVGRINE